MISKIRVLIISLLALTLPFSMGVDCTGDPIVPATGLIYVLDSLNNAVYVLDNIGTVDGDTDAVRTISGDKTLMENPTAIAVDGIRDILYVADANRNEILVFKRASTLDGDVNVFVKLPAGPNIRAMTYDEENDRLYVSDIATLQILLWDNVSEAEDGQTATQFFTLDFIASAIFIDSQRDFLYVGNPGFMNIQVFNQASTLIGDPLPTRIFFDPNKPFDFINSITMNLANDILFVAESRNPSIDIFDNASDLMEEVEVNREIEGGDTELTDRMRKIKFLNNVLYVSVNDTQIGIWNNANKVDGDTAPDRKVTVNQADRIQSFDIDLLH